jgi:tol-pal system protein YbgF
VGKVDALQKEVATLRGQVEELTHQLELAQNQQKAMFSDLDNRLASNKPGTSAASSPAPEKIEPIADRPKDVIAVKTTKSATPPPIIRSDTTASSPSPKAVASNQPNVAEEQQIYQTAYDLIKSKKYNEAVNTLQKMLQRYPSGQSAANAHYWLGELYGLLNKNEQAANEFSIVVKNYPDSPKVGDAELKLGFIYLAQFKWADAKTSFKNVATRYPGTASARSASDQLKQIKLAGH